MKGRKPKPKKLKMLQGNPGKRELKDEPEPEACIPSMPEFLFPEAQEEWHRIAPQLFALGLLSELDRAALAAYCVAWGQHVLAEKAIAEIREKGQTELAGGLVVKKTSTGNLAISPLLQISQQAMTLAMKFAVEFGMTPSARTRVYVQPRQPKNEWDKFFK
jgi:P27 family predicted phage terminase small subunit